MDSNLGWIKLWRKLEDNPIFKNPRLLQLWIYCLFKANHKKNKAMIGFQEIPLKPGQFITGRHSLAKDIGLKPRSARSSWNWLKILESMQFLTIKSTNKFSIVSINNWDSYQGQVLEDFQQHYQRDTNKIPSKYQQDTTDNNVKNDKNVKNNISSDYFFLANILKTRILQNNPKAKITDSQVKQWTEIVRLMVERDQRSLSEIENIIEFCQDDDFWKSNILSMQKLRKQFDQLTMKMNQKKYSNIPQSQKSFVPKEYKPPELPKDMPETIKENQKKLRELMEKL